MQPRRAAFGHAWSNCVEIGVVLHHQLLMICECDLPATQAIAVLPERSAYMSRLPIPTKATTFPHARTIEGMVNVWENEGTANQASLTGSYQQKRQVIEAFVCDQVGMQGWRRGKDQC